jgi:hypothetical protein
MLVGKAIKVAARKAVAVDEEVVAARVANATIEEKEMVTAMIVVEEGEEKDN